MIITSDKLIPLSATTDKLDLHPELYNYKDGYKLYKHNIFNKLNDLNYGSKSLFNITKSLELGNFINDSYSIKNSNLVFFTTLRMSNGNYIRRHLDDDILYADWRKAEDLTFFRITKESDGYYTISQDNKYATVIRERNSFTIQLQDRKDIDVYNTQKFTIKTYDTQGNITIRSMFKMGTLWPTMQNTIIERYWSFYDYNNGTVIKANGLIKNDDYVDENNYVIEVDFNLGIFVIGFEGNTRWVKYHNDFFEKFFNKSTNIESFIEHVELNYLIDIPYNNNIDIVNNSIDINIMNLKNTVTTEYENHILHDNSSGVIETVPTPSIIRIDCAELQFGTTAVNDIKTGNIKLTNVGSVDVSILSINYSHQIDFITNTYSGVIHPNEEIDIAFSFKPLSLGDKYCYINVITDELACHPKCKATGIGV